MIYVALQDTEGNWIDHHEELLVADGTSPDWQVVQSADEALRLVEEFASGRLAQA